MDLRIRAVYDRGAFVPVTPCDLPEKTKVELFVQLPALLPATIRDPAEKAKAVKRVVEQMRLHPLPANAAPYSRDELHERG